MSIASLYPSINPSLLLDFANSKVLDPRITFTRTTTATYYDGVTTAKAEENLLTYSQEFDNAAWSKSQVTVTANATTAPDGTSTAESMVGDGTANFHLIAQNIPALVSANTYALSMYAKANGLNYIQIHTNSSPDGRANFDITSGAGAVGTVSGNFSGAAITSVGNGWFRCTVLLTSSAAVYFQIGLISSATGARAESFTTSNGAYIWGAQLEDRSSATAYTATTTQAITNYIPVLQTAAAGQARFDHNPTTGESLGLLIEEARTNLLQRSEEFDNAYWTKNASVTATSNQAVSPDGTIDADQLNIVGTGVATQIYRAVTVSNATAYTMSLFVKYYSGTNGDFLISMGSDTTRGIRVTVSASSLTISEVGANVTASGFQSVGDGWFRIYLTITSTSTSFEYNIYRPTAYGGSGTNSFFIWGAQLEAGSFATSYIPTVASTVTRNADAASMTGTNFSSWFNNGEGTLYGEGLSQPSLTTTSGGNAATIANIDTGTTGNALPRLARNSGGTGRYAYYVNGQYEAHFTDLGTWSNSTNGKLIGVYKANDFAASFNGGAVQTDNTGVLGVADRINIGRYVSDGYWNSTIKKLAYYPIRVTNTQLQSLTV